MALANRRIEPDQALAKTPEQRLLDIVAEKFRLVRASEDGTGEVTVYFKTRRAVRITATMSELIEI